MQHDLNIAIIGPGRAGMAIALAAIKTGLNLVAIGGRNLKFCQKAVESLRHVSAPVSSKEVSATDPASACRAAQLVFLAVSDGAVQTLCHELVKEQAFSPGTTVAHLSGALPSEILASARISAGCSIASAHPLQTFVGAEFEDNPLKAIHWFLEGDKEAIEVLSEFVRVTGGRPEIITAQAKPLYHAASVIASNYLTTLIDVASSVMEEAGIARTTSISALEPLIKSAVKNTFSLGPEEALTGPISRGDDLTVRTHLRGLGLSKRNFATIYKVLGRHAIDLSLRKGSIDKKQAEVLMKTLTSEQSAP